MAAGIPFEDFLAQNIFEPAGMTSARYCHIRRDGIPFDNFVGGIVLENGDYVFMEDSKSESDEVADDGENGAGHEVHKRDGDLWVKAIKDNGSSTEFKIYPIGENESSWKRGLLKMSFGDGFYKIEDQICKKREAS